jgi:tetrapyrrole methylase family protein/MazG family protein
VPEPTVVVAGLGPGPEEGVSLGLMSAVEATDHVFLRTARHPSAHLVAPATTFDHHYDAAHDFESVYRAIVEDLVAAAHAHGRVLYVVPGSPRVLERSVDLLVADTRVRTVVLPAMSFVDLAWVRLGVDPFEAGVRIVDGHRFAERAAGERGPLLVGHCHSRAVLSEIKLAFDRESPTTATVLQRLGLDDEAVYDVAWDDLDRAVDPDHLTALWVPEVAAPVAAELVRFAEVVRRLRTECPWDREQTHRSLSRYLLEESYELLDALDHLDPEDANTDDALEEELGDLLFQVFLHATLAAERGAFTLADVAARIADKLIGRHPHVYGDADPTSTLASWEQHKRDEKGRESVMDGVPEGLPALLLALKVQKKAASQGVDWQSLLTGDEDELALRLLDAVDAARAAGHDPEDLLRRATTKLRDAARGRGI